MVERCSFVCAESLCFMSSFFPTYLCVFRRIMFGARVDKKNVGVRAKGKRGGLEAKISCFEDDIFV